MIETLDRTVVGTLDLKEQPKADYILLVGNGPGKAYYYIDGWNQNRENMEFHRDGRTIYVCRQEALWGVIAAEVTELLTNADLMRQGKKEMEAMEKLHDELSPPEKEEEKSEWQTRRPGVYL